MDTIRVWTTVSQPVQVAWRAFTDPEAIREWNHASDDWHCPEASNDLREGGTFTYVMASRDGQARFDFSGTYTSVVPEREIAYELGDGRGVHIGFEARPDGGTTVTETFDPEDQNPHDLQRAGWQAILDNYRRYVEG